MQADLDAPGVTAQPERRSLVRSVASGVWFVLVLGGGQILDSKMFFLDQLLSRCQTHRHIFQASC